MLLRQGQVHAHVPMRPMCSRTAIHASSAVHTCSTVAQLWPAEMLIMQQSGCSGSKMRSHSMDNGALTGVSNPPGP